MRAIIQRVKKANVKVNNKVVGQINKGFLVLLGIEDADNQEDIEWLSGKISRLRVFDDENGQMNLGLQDISGEVLVVSQFTLHASTKKGNRPSFIKASKPSHSLPLYEAFVYQMTKDCGKRPATGEFGAMMDVELINDGPVTLFIDTKNKE